jgi:DNA-binding winged helix-turn-helix (wHTH) protein
MRISFGEFILDTDERRLLAGEREVHLSPKTFDLLAMLLESRPKALSKDVIFARLWPDVFVTENNLATLVTDLRAALGDDAHRPEFIRTVYAYGYAFIGDAIEQSPIGTPLELVSDEPVRAPSEWRLIHEHREIPLVEGANVLGRSGAGVIVLESPTISRHHAKLSIAGDRATVEDLGSKNGTWIGTVPVAAAAPLRDGDELRLGSVVMVLRFGGDGSSTETVATAGD